MSELRNHAATRWDLDRIFRLGGLGSPFTNNVTFADVDFEIERRGRFLVLEGKRTGFTLSTGQEIAMKARVRTGRTCLVFWGDPEAGNVERIGAYVPRFSGASDYRLDSRPADNRSLFTFCAAWWTWASSQLPAPAVPSSFDALAALQASALSEAA